MIKLLELFRCIKNRLTGAKPTQPPTPQGGGGPPAPPPSTPK